MKFSQRQFSAEHSRTSPHVSRSALPTNTRPGQLKSRQMENYMTKKSLIVQAQRNSLCSYQLASSTITSLRSCNSPEDNHHKGKSRQHPRNPRKGFQSIQLTTVYKMPAAIQPSSKRRCDTCSPSSPEYPRKRQKYEMGCHTRHDASSCRV